MNRPLSVLLVEDEPADCKAITYYIDSLEDVRLIGVTNNAGKALEYAIDYLPDVIILDLELHKGSGNGISFLNELRAMQLSFFPYVLVTTNNVSPITHRQVRQLGADFVMVKSQDDYSAANVVEFLRSLKNVIHDARKKTPAPEAQSPEDRKKRVFTQVATEIDLVGISPKAIGRKYLIDAILLLLEGQSRSQVTVVAEKYGKSYGSVERAMQTAIDRAWKTSDIEDLHRCYTARISSEKGVPTLTEFIYYFANKVKIK